MMKYIWICLFLIQWANVPAEEVKPACIQGKILNFAGGEVKMYYQEKTDTLRVDENGVFRYCVTRENPGMGTLVFEEYKCRLPLFIENGMQAELTIGFVQKNDEKYGIFYEPQVEYKGDNGDCTAFLKAYEDWSLMKNPWPFTRLDTLSFAEYREKFLEDVDRVKCELFKIKSLAFRQAMTEMIDYSVAPNLFRFAWGKSWRDADFEKWVEAFDRNDPENGELASNYLRWYLKKHPAATGENRGIHHLNALKKVFQNQEIINDFADGYIDQYLKQAPEDMAEVFEAYKHISTDTAAHARNRKVYEHYVKMMPGAQAIDFGMTGTDGKKYRLSDFRGKAVYIDVWATWCGPCCAEIPYVEKLAEHFAGNKKIEFLSISVDENQAKWRKKLAADKPRWKQFICPDNFQSALCREYDIDGIPRFLFFDKKGRIISLDAPRPSSPGIIEYIGKHIR